jgi:hypothetical protein
MRMCEQIHLLLSRQGNTLVSARSKYGSICPIRETKPMFYREHSYLVRVLCRLLQRVDSKAARWSNRTRTTLTRLFGGASGMDAALSTFFFAEKKRGFFYSDTEAVKAQ